MYFIEGSGKLISYNSLDWASLHCPQRNLIRLDACNQNRKDKKVTKKERKAKESAIDY